jgi:hypothetical protein
MATGNQHSQPQQSEKRAASAAGSPTTRGAATIDRLGEQVRFGHQAWLERLREMQDVEAEFVKEILEVREPTAALKICNRWIARRLALLGGDSNAFAGFWMDLVMTASGSTSVPGAGPSEK